MISFHRIGCGSPVQVFSLYCILGFSPWNLIGFMWPISLVSRGSFKKPSLALALVFSLNGTEALHSTSGFMLSIQVFFTARGSRPQRKWSGGKCRGREDVDFLKISKMLYTISICSSLSPSLVAFTRIIAPNSLNLFRMFSLVPKVFFAQTLLLV